MSGKKLIFLIGIIAILSSMVGGSLIFFAGPYLGGLINNSDQSSPSQHGDEKDHPGKDKEEHKDEGLIQITPEEIEEFDIRLSIAGPGKLKSTLDLTGEVALNPDRTSHIVPRVSGIVHKVLKQLGDSVEKNELLAILESTELAQIKIKYLRLKSKLKLAEIDLQRNLDIFTNTTLLLKLLKKSPKLDEIKEKIEALNMGENRRKLISSYASLKFSRETFWRERELFGKKISSEADYLQAEREYKKSRSSYFSTYDEVSFAIQRQLTEKKRDYFVAKSALETTERRLHVLGLSEKDLKGLKNGSRSHQKMGQIELRAPFAGTIIEKHISLGELLHRENTPFIVSDLKKVWIKLNLYQKDLPFVKSGQQVFIFSEKKLYQAEGTISYISPTVNEKTRTATVVVVIKNPKGVWKPGLFVTAKVVQKEKKVPLLIPKTALQTIGDEYYVFVKTKGGFKAQKILLGKRDHSSVEVRLGLKSGVTYATKGVFTIKAQMSVGDLDSGHSH